MFLKIPQKTHFLLVAHIFSAAKQIYNNIPQYRNTKETKPRKKIHQIRSNWEKKEEREATGLRWDRAAEAKARSRGGGNRVRSRGEIARWRWRQARSNRVHRRWVWGGMIRSTESWVGDWIWASPAIALFVLRLGLGVSDESEIARWRRRRAWSN